MRFKEILIEYCEELDKDMDEVLASPELLNDIMDYYKAKYEEAK